ncbi:MULTISPECIES: MATE family efflux transporter [unclassified Aliivibrio]|jgi:putative MATE family efflux protein|uniref:MATE family efflux transporter n=1 Tax=unclassified Aliivibrio TaxID=2645654 RepID=UPI00080E6DD4|nr:MULTISPECIES: MATE family efflux transporter [unclassified Aliivibrio]OCH15033.1 MATE family efflux transporter [Aliivibrio sp. 1S128]OCH16048.1 MATE family efflux transporter [Aliivibrio sp. 1S165]OCH26911.1 MATE family efflux transporter [Aliivibrio sp. 1S175]
MTTFHADSSITRTFWRYAIPSIAAMVVSGLYQIIDGIFVGHYIGFEGLAGINMAWPAICILGALGVMIGMGTGSVMSIYRGENKLDKTKVALTTGIWLLAILSIVAIVCIVFFAENILHAQGAEGKNFDFAMDYINVLMFGGFFTACATALPMLVRNDEAPNVATFLLVVGALINIVLDYLFIGVMGLGLSGAALATLLAQSVVTVLGIRYFFTKRSSIQLSLKDVLFSKNKAKQSLALGSSALVMYMYGSFVVAMHNALMMHYGSATTVGAYAIVGYLFMLYYLLAQGIAEGAQPPISYYYGAKENKKVYQIFKLALKWVTITGVAWVGILNISPELTTALFTNGDQSLIAETIVGIRYHLFAIFLDGIIVLVTIYFLSVSESKKAMVISISNIIIQLPFLLILPKWFGIDGVWLAMPISNIALIICITPMVWGHLKAQKIIKPLPLSHVFEHQSSASVE